MKIKKKNEGLYYWHKDGERKRRMTSIKDHYCTTSSLQSLENKAQKLQKVLIGTYKAHKAMLLSEHKLIQRL